MKKFILFFAFTGLITLGTWAQTWNCGAQGNNLTATLSGSSPNYTLTISGSGAMADYAFNTMPWFSYKSQMKYLVIGDSVTSIGNNAFQNCINFTGNLTIPNSVTSIGNNAFQYCSNFNGNLTISNSVTTIGNYAFDHCYGFTVNLTIPNSVTYIGNYAFQNCNKFTGNLIISNSVITIGKWAFAFCSGFTGDLTIGNSVKTIGERAFDGCSGFTGNLTIGGSVTNIIASIFRKCKFTTINVNSGNSHYIADNGVLFTINKDTLICCPVGKTGNYTIPNSVITIGESAFESCNGLTGSLIIPNSVITIDRVAFYKCTGFTSLTIGNSVTTIESHAFEDCSGFTGNLIIPNSVTDLNGWVFENCSGFTGDLIIPNSVITIAAGNFQNCSGFNGNLIIGNSVKYIGNYAFYNCNFIGDLIIPNLVTLIGDYAFGNCSGLQTINFNAIDCTYIGNYVWNGCTSLTTLNIGNQVKRIPDYAFYGCTGFIGDLIIPNSVTNIDNSAFDGCSGFNGNLIIGNSVTTIGNYAFYDCSALTSITAAPIIPPTLGIGVFYNIPTGIPVYVPCGSISNYQSASGWSSFSNYQDTLSLPIPNNITIIEQNATLELTWQNIGALSYKIYRNGILIDSTTTNNYTDSINLIIGTNYCYQIKAINGVNCTSQLSTAVCKVFGASTDATLATLTVSTGTLTPTFNSSTYNYSVNVANSVNTILITAIPNHPQATLIGDGSKTLQVGVNQFIITVTAEDGITTQNYTVTINRDSSTDATLANLTVSTGTLTPTFNSSTYNYSVNVANSINTILITAIPNHPQATLIGDGSKTLQVGVNQFIITVTAEDGITTQNYTVTINRDSVTPTIATISGFVLDSTSTPVSGGIVRLYKLQTLSQFSLAASELVESDGSYLFTNVNAGSYIIKAEAQISANSLDTWHLNTEVWNLATVITVATNPIQNINITLVPIPTINGNNSISGFVSGGSGGQKSLSATKSNNPAKDVTVYLQRYQNDSWITISQRYTDENGYYIFTNVPSGTYQVILDIPGLEMKETQEIELNNGENIELADYIITENGIYNDASKGIDNYELGITNYELSVYPNPTNGIITIRTAVGAGITPDQNGASIQIYDISGRVVQTQLIESQRNTNEFTIDISNLQQGMYYVRVGNETAKIIKN